jgi:hypothetical protein
LRKAAGELKMPHGIPEKTGNYLAEIHRATKNWPQPIAAQASFRSSLNYQISFKYGELSSSK